MRDLAHLYRSCREYRFACERAGKGTKNIERCVISSFTWSRRTIPVRLLRPGRGPWRARLRGTRCYPHCGKTARSQCDLHCQRRAASGGNTQGQRDPLGCRSVRDETLRRNGCGNRNNQRFAPAQSSIANLRWANSRRNRTRSTKLKLRCGASWMALTAGASKRGFIRAG